MRRSFTGCQAFAPQKRPRTFVDYGALSGIAATFKEDDTLSRITVHFQGRRHTFADYGALSRKTTHFRGLRCTFKEDDTLSRITVHFQGRRHTFADYGALSRKTTHFRGLRCTFKEDDTLLRILAHLQGSRHTFADYGALSGIAAHLQVQHNCGAAVAVQRTRLRVRRGTLRCVFKCHCGTFVELFLTRTVITYVPTYIDYSWLSLARGSGSLTPRFRFGPPRTEPKGPSGPPRFCGAMCARWRNVRRR